MKTLGHEPPQYVVDVKGNRVAVMLDIASYEQLLEAAEEVNCVRAYDAAKPVVEAELKRASSPRSENTKRRAPVPAGELPSHHPQVRPQETGPFSGQPDGLDSGGIGRFGNRSSSTRRQEAEGPRGLRGWRGRRPAGHGWRRGR